MKDSRIYIIHIRDCLNRIEAYTTEGKAAFFEDIKTQDAVIRNLGNHGRCRAEVAGFRNVLAHQYLDINLNLVWDIIKNQLPVLNRAIEAIAEEFWNQ
jgi:uncharacterized protein with HEPN domain